MSLAENVTTLPQSRDGSYEFARFNALRHGVLSQHTVLPWEDGNEYRVLVEALTAEHEPKGPTEEHLVEELAGVIWRKRRLRLGEAAAHHRALKRASDPYQYTAEAALIIARGCPGLVAPAAQLGTTRLRRRSDPVPRRRRGPEAVPLRMRYYPGTRSGGES